MEEVWKEIEEFKGHYEVSNLGRVRSVDRYVGKRLYPSKIIKNCVNSKDNTVLVRLYISRVAYVRSVAKLVVQTFLGSPCKRIQCFSTTAQAVKHIDGNPFNNRLDNLQWRKSNVDSALPNKKARELFVTKAEEFVNIFIAERHCYNLTFGEVGADDLKQECLLKIWSAIDCASAAALEKDDAIRYFFDFCIKLCKWQYSQFFKKYKERHRYIYFSQLQHENECFAENVIEELPCFEYYDKDRLEVIR